MNRVIANRIIIRRSQLKGAIQRRGPNILRQGCRRQVLFAKGTRGTANARPIQIKISKSKKQLRRGIATPSSVWRAIKVRGWHGHVHGSVERGAVTAAQKQD